jgi:hypothetical protein
MAERPRAYGRYKGTAQNRSVMTSLKPDAWQAVEELMTREHLSASGAVHHLVRLAAGLPPLNPL